MILLYRLTESLFIHNVLTLGVFFSMEFLCKLCEMLLSVYTCRLDLLHYTASFRNIHIHGEKSILSHEAYD